jgi:hypothetical protein
VVGEVAEKGYNTMKPVTYDAHIEQWKIDLKRRRKDKTEGGNRD